MEIFRYTDCLESDQEFLHCCFKAIDKQITLAKITIYVNPFHKIDDQQVAVVGYFTCVNDQEVFNLLMDAVKAEVIKLGAKFIAGPMDGSTWNTYRLVTSPQPDPFFLEVITPPYHEDLFKNYGFKTLAKYLSTKTSALIDNWEESAEHYAQFLEMGVQFEMFNKQNPDEEFEEIGKLCNSAFANNFMFSPIRIEQFIEKMMPLNPIINPRYTLIARHEGKAVGFIFCYADLNNKKDKIIVVKTLARDNDSRYKGMGSVLSSLSMKNVKEDGFSKGIHALMVDYNTSTYISINFQGEFLRSYELLSFKVND